MKTLVRIALWLLVMVAMLIGVCMIVGVDVDNMLWTVVSKPIGFVVCYVAYKLMMWGCFDGDLINEEA